MGIKFYANFEKSAQKDGKSSSPAKRVEIMWFSIL
jgi:hypothetical protein